MLSKTKRLAIGSSMMAAAILGGLLTPSVAYAGDYTCKSVLESLTKCGGVTNLSSTAIVAYMSWCDGNNGPCSNSHQRRLTQGQATPSLEDWDAAWLPCRAVGYKTVAGGAVRYPWTGGGGKAGGIGAHKVSSPEQLVITGVFC